jgi:hypothetical protein
MLLVFSLSSRQFNAGLEEAFVISHLLEVTVVIWISSLESEYH